MGYIAEPGLEAFLPPIESEKWTTEIVVSVHYWTSTLISFRTTRSCGFRFTPGQYARLGLAGAEGIDVWRPISVVSAANDEALEFLVVLIPGGAFSARQGAGLCRRAHPRGGALTAVLAYALVEGADCVCR